MGDAPQDASGRLDSWKAIATYLNRDERTVRRWESQLGLPIRRLPGPRGTSVFAYPSEIDAWMQTAKPSGRPAITPSVGRRRWLGAAGLLLLASGAALWAVVGRRTSAPPVRAEVTPTGIVAFDAAGAERWRYPFPSDDRFAPPPGGRTPVEIVAGKDPAILAAAGFWVHKADESYRNGQLLWLTPRGVLQRTFSFDDRLTFGAGEYGAPWVISDFRVNEQGPRRVALVGRHAQWWPSMVTVLDDQWRRRGTFVHAGWIDRVHWLSPDRLLVAGFSEALDGGAVAILDANAMDGQSPVEAGSPFSCASCGASRPIRYVVMPRSEVNRVTVSRFNRARLEVGADRIVVRTIEVPAAEGDAIDALYEFSPALDLFTARFSERYWDVHRALEAQGKLNHTREHCPDRDGPREIQVWEPQTGWRTKKIR